MGTVLRKCRLEAPAVSRSPYRLPQLLTKLLILSGLLRRLSWKARSLSEECTSAQAFLCSFERCAVWTATEEPVTQYVEFRTIDSVPAASFMRGVHHSSHFLPPEILFPRLPKMKKQLVAPRGALDFQSVKVPSPRVAAFPPGYHFSHACVSPLSVSCPLFSCDLGINGKEGAAIKIFPFITCTRVTITNGCCAHAFLENLRERGSNYYCCVCLVQFLGVIFPGKKVQ